MIDQASTLSAAAALAERNLQANLRALRDRQAQLAAEVADSVAGVEWLFARDGSLTARTPDGRWWSGCSLPRRAAQAVLEKMELGAVVTCYLAPTHAAQVRFTLDRLTDRQALIAAVPDVDDLRVVLACESFAGEISAGRMWFAWGEDWDRKLELLLTEQDGLPIPGQFVRTALIEDEQSQAMIARAQGVLSHEIGRRAELTRLIFAESRPNLDEICAIAPAAFRLWEDAGQVIGELAAAGGWRVLDPDDPCQASPVALARAAAGCGAVVAANLGRADLPETLPQSTCVVTWLTGPRIPRFDPRAPGDALIVADERWRGLAIAAGWPAERVVVGTWTASGKAVDHGPQASRLNDRSAGGLSVIADTLPIVRPDFDLSSHNVLWDTIAQELAADPFAVGNDAQAYLARWLRRANINEGTVDVRTFVDRLILPAYQQGLVRTLLQSGIDVTLHGKGWNQIDDLALHHRGTVDTRHALRRAIDACAGLVHVWPSPWSHPIDRAGRPVLRRTFRGTDAWLAEAKRLAAGGRDVTTSPGAPAISAEQVMDLIRSTRPAHLAGAA